MPEGANHIFLPWVQPGVASNIPDQSKERLNAEQPSVVSLPIQLVVNAESINKTARLYGPGDVTGIDIQQIVRIEPRHLTTDFEPNYFPGIEFDRPDFPWLFTPAKADDQSRLRPWLCLIVVRQQPGVELRAGGRLPVAVLEIKFPAVPRNELPDLSESHLWAHAQITGGTKADLRNTLAGDPARSVSRLLCPRKLQPTTEYIACLVPTFEVGRKSALNLPIDSNEEKRLEPSWQSGDGSPKDITLPVYFSWQFRTSKDGDFEELVRRLEPRVLPQEVGKLPIDISRPAFKIEPATPAGTTLQLEGALRVVKSDPDPWPDDVRKPFQNALEKILNRPWDLVTQGGPDKDPLIGPPVYGCWQAAVHRVFANNDATPAGPWPPAFWLDEMNLDPRHRSVAAMGTKVIQDQQEQLMASAWEQLGDIEKINQRLRQAQLSRAVNDKYLGKTFNRLPPEAFVKVVSPAQSRVMIEDTPPNQPAGTVTKMFLSQRLATSFVPTTAVSAPVRKLTRPRGSVNRQYVRQGVAGVQAMFAVFNRPDFIIASTGPSPSRGAITIDQVSDMLPSSGQFIWVDPTPTIPGHWERMRATVITMNQKFRQAKISGPEIANLNPAPPPSPFYEAAKAHHQYLSLLTIQLIFADFRRAITTQEIKAAALPSLNPARTVSKAVFESIKVSSPPSLSGDELEPIMDAPTFPQPMYEGLRDVGQNFLFPGLEHVPPNTVQLLQTNAKFIESFMVGLNAEMSRELLWRNYPTDQRGTYFQQFWDTVSAGAQAKLDIPPIHKWGKRPLGTTAAGADGDKLVLLIRGELLRRYPNTVIYAAKAIEQTVQRPDPDNPAVKKSFIERVPSTNPNEESHPIFRGTLEPDVTFIGFDLTYDEVMAGKGWYFVLQQQPTEPRFGLDDDPFGEGESGKIPELKTWDDLNWAHLAPSAEAIASMSHILVKKFQLTESQPTKGIWNRNSAHMAYITKQRFVRIAIHAAELLPVVS